MIEALIFDMDGTMIDSMGHHRLSWIEFARRHALGIDVDDLMRRTTGRTGAECMADLFGRALDRAGIVGADRREGADLSRAVRARVPRGGRLPRLRRQGTAPWVQGSASAPPVTATTSRSRCIIWRWTRRRMPSSAATRACPASPSRRSFSKSRAASAWRRPVAWCSRTHRSASRPRAAPAWPRWPSAAATVHTSLAGPHVLAAIDHYNGADAADILATLTTISETFHVA